MDDDDLVARVAADDDAALRDAPLERGYTAVLAEARA
jgi:hypothetical protein